MVGGLGHRRGEGLLAGVDHPAPGLEIAGLHEGAVADEAARAAPEGHDVGAGLGPVVVTVAFQVVAAPVRAGKLPPPHRGEPVAGGGVTRGAFGLAPPFLFHALGQRQPGEDLQRVEVHAVEGGVVDGLDVLFHPLLLRLARQTVDEVGHQRDAVAAHPLDLAQTGQELLAVVAAPEAPAQLGLETLDAEGKARRAGLQTRPHPLIVKRKDTAFDGELHVRRDVEVPINRPDDAAELVGAQGRRCPAAEVDHIHRLLGEDAAGGLALDFLEEALRVGLKRGIVRAMRVEAAEGAPAHAEGNMHVEDQGLPIGRHRLVPGALEFLGRGRPAQQGKHVAVRGGALLRKTLQQLGPVLR